MLFVTVVVTNSLTISGVTYDGESMTQIASYGPTPGGATLYQFRLINPASSGANNVVITASGTATFILSTAISFTVTNPDTGTNTNTVNGSSITTLANPLAVDDGSWIVLSGNADSNNVTAGTNTTSTTTANPMTGRFGPRSGAGSTSLSIDSAVADVMYSIVTELKESSGAGTPTLSSPTATVISDTEATVGVTTDKDNGTLYCVVTTSSTAPSEAQVKAGQDHTGSAAVFDDSQAISSTGAKTFNATGLTAGTTYYAHFMHEAADTSQSTVSSTSAFITKSLIAVTDANWFFSPYNWLVS